MHGETEGDGRQGAAHVTHVGIHRSIGEFSVLVIVVGLAGLRIDAGVLIATEEPHRISFLEPGGELHVTEVGTLLVTHGGLQIGDLVLQGGQVAVDAVAEIADAVLPAEFELPAGVVHGARIHGVAGDTHFSHRRDPDQKVLGILVEPVDTQSQAVVEHAQVETEVSLDGSLPSQFRIGQAGRLGAEGRRITRSELITGAVVGDGRRPRIAGEDGDVTVDTPGSADLQEVQDIPADVVLDEGLIADGPTGGNGGEVAPAVLHGKLGRVEGVRAEVGLEAVAVVVAVGQTAEVGNLRALARVVAADALGAGAVVLAEVAEILEIALERVVAFQAAAHAAAVRVSVGHTGHGTDGVIAQRDIVVGKVFPLIVVALRRLGADLIFLGIGLGIRVERLLEIGLVLLLDTVTQAGGEHKALERGEVGVHGTADLPAFFLLLVAVAVDERVDTVTFQDLGNGIVQVRIVCGAVNLALAVVHVFLHILRELVIGVIDRGQRVDDEGAQQAGAAAGILGMLADLLLLAALDGGVGTHGKPGLDLVVGIHLAGETLENIGISTGHTVFVQVVQGDEIGTAVVAALGSDGVVVGDARSVQDIRPVGVRGTVPLAGGDQIVDGRDVAELHLPVNVLLGVHHLGMVAQPGQGEFIIIKDVAVPVLVLATVLGGDEHDTVTGLRTVDGGGGGILQNLHGFDHGRIEVVDLVDLQTVHDEERAEAGAAVGGDTADADGGTFTRGAGIVEDLDAGGLALEGGGGIGSGTVHQFLGADGRHRAGEIALALHAVTDDDSLIDEFGVLHEDKCEFGSVADRDHLAGIADAGYLKVGSGRHIQTERTVRVGNGTDGSIADDDHGGSDDRSARTVNNCSSDCPVLRGSDESAQKNGEKYDDSHRS